MISVTRSSSGRTSGRPATGMMRTSGAVMLDSSDTDAGVSFVNLVDLEKDNRPVLQVARVDETAAVQRTNILDVLDEVHDFPLGSLVVAAHNDVALHRLIDLLELGAV